MTDYRQLVAAAAGAVDVRLGQLVRVVRRTLALTLARR